MKRKSIKKDIQTEIKFPILFYFKDKTLFINITYKQKTMSKELILFIVIITIGLFSFHNALSTTISNIGIVTPSIVINDQIFKSNTIACTNQFLSTFNNVTGLFTCSTPIDTNTAQLANADNGISLLGTHPNATLNNVKTLRIGTGISLPNNSTSITITNTGVLSFNGSTGSLNINHHDNMSSISLFGSTFQFINKPNVVQTNGSAQIVTKSITFVNAGLRIFNPLQTFFYSIQTLGLTANEILFLPLIQGTEIIQVEPNINQTAGGNTTSTSATPTMHGLHLTIITKDKARIFVQIADGWTQPSSTSTGCRLTVQFGTGSPPTAGSVLVGTQAFNNQQSASTVSGAKIPISLGGWIVATIQPYTKYWVDIAESNISGATGSCGINNPELTLTGY